MNVPKLAVASALSAAVVATQPVARAYALAPWGDSPAVAGTGQSHVESRAVAQQAGAEIAALRQRVTELEEQLAALRTRHEQQLEAIESRLAALEARAGEVDEAAVEEPGEEAAAMSPEERAELERELAAALGAEPPAAAGAGAQTGQGGEQRFGSRTRTLRELNPEISATGDLFGTFADRTGDPEANQFRFAEFEIALQAPLDPFSAAKFFVVQEEGNFELEEGYIEYNTLPGGLGVKAGAMRLDWAKLNRWHQHALPQADRPLVHQAIWGEDGLRGLGASVSWLAPPFLGDYNEIVVQVTNDDNDTSFSGRGFDDPVFVVHETNYWDLSPASYFELGASAATGVNDPLGEFRTKVYGIDWNFNWAPPAEALYKGFELRGELLWQRRDGAEGASDNVGAFTFGTYKLNRRWFTGARLDWTELPYEPSESVWGFSPYVEWWQSEWARLRLQYSYNSRQFEEPDPEHRFFFQITWAIGPHKHEKY